MLANRSICNAFLQKYIFFSTCEKVAFGIGGRGRCLSIGLVIGLFAYSVCCYF